MPGRREKMKRVWGVGGRGHETGGRAGKRTVRGACAEAGCSAMRLCAARPSHAADASRGADRAPIA